MNIGDYHLTPVLRQIADVIGVEATFQIALEKSGHRLYIPKTITQGTKISQIIGNELAQKLSHQYGGSNFLIPHAKKQVALWLIRDHKKTKTYVSNRLKVALRTLDSWTANKVQPLPLFDDI